jgi:hypothetical protein
MLVVRGGALDSELELLRADAVRFKRRYLRWGRYGLSAYLATNEQEIDVLCKTRLERFGTVAVFHLSALQAAGIEVVPRFAAPMPPWRKPISTYSSTASAPANIEY